MTASGITVLCLVLLAANARLPSLGDLAARARYDLLTLGLVVCLLNLLCKAIRWRLLYPPGSRPSLRLAVAAIAVGQVTNWVVPLRLGEIVRVGLASSRLPAVQSDPGSRVGLGIGVLVAEKVLDGLMLATTVLLLATIGGLPSWVSLLPVLGIAAFSAGAVAFALWLRHWRIKGQTPMTVGLPWHHAGLSHLQALMRHVASPLAGFSAWLRPKLAAQVIFWSAAAWTLGGLINYLVLRSLGLDASIGAALAVLAALAGAATLPSLPGRVGLFQYVAVLALLPFGLSFDEALAFSLALYGIVYLPPLGIGVLAVVLVGPDVRSIDGRPILYRPHQTR